MSVFFSAFFVFWVASVAFWIWALVDAIRVPEDRFYRAGTKLVWVLLIALTQLIGAIIYVAVGRPDASVRATMTSSASPPGVVPAPPPGSISPPPQS